MSNELEEIVDELDDQVEDDQQEEELEADPYEEEALEFGWKAPSDDWKGDKPPMTAEQWMERGPGTSRKALAQVANLTKELETVKRSSERSLRATKAAADARIEGEIKRIKAEKVKAVEEGDTDKYKTLEAEETQVQQSSSAEDDILKDWVAETSWFNKDQVMTGAATALFGEAERSGITDTQAKLDYVDNKLREEMPHKFEAPKEKPKRKAAAVEAGGRSVRRSNGVKGWNDIPSSDRTQAQEQIDDGDFDHLAEKNKVSAKEAYAEMYWSQ